MKEKVRVEVKGWDYLSLALLAFGGLGIEVIYAFWLEPLIYRTPMQEWQTWQMIAHWVVTCATWGIVGYLLAKSSRTKYQFSLLEEGTKMKLWQWAAAAVCIGAAIFSSYLDWGGFKVIVEFQNKGLLLFLFQYLYYVFETLLFMLIIVFAQRAFEVWFQNNKIPFGGIICGITWGLAHIFTKGSLLIGLQGVFLGFLLGSAYLFAGKDVRKAYVILFIMFAF